MTTMFLLFGGLVLMVFLFSVCAAVDDIVDDDTQKSNIRHGVFRIAAAISFLIGIAVTLLVRHVFTINQ